MSIILDSPISSSELEILKASDKALDFALVEATPMIRFIQPRGTLSGLASPISEKTLPSLVFTTASQIQVLLFSDTGN